MDIYSILKAWHEWRVDTESVDNNHAALFFYILDLNNRLAWKEVIGLPTTESSEYLGISTKTFRKILKELADFGWVEIVKLSKNQYTSTRISLRLLGKKLPNQSQSTYKAFVQAQQKQLPKHSLIDRHIIHKDINTYKHVESNDSAMVRKDFVKLDPRIKTSFKKFLDVDLKANKTNLKAQKTLINKLGSSEKLDAVIRGVAWLNKNSEYPYVIESLSSLNKKLDKILVRIKNEKNKQDNLPSRGTVIKF